MYLFPLQIDRAITVHLNYERNKDDSISYDKFNKMTTTVCFQYLGQKIILYDKIAKIGRT